MTSMNPPEGAEEEAKGPRIDSEDPQERINTRRLRIAARVEAKKREALEDPNAKTDIEEVLSKSRKQIEESYQRLTKLQRDGTQLVTNIQVAEDAREAQRRIEEEEARRLRTEKLENEAKTSQEKYEEISKKWISAKAKEIPQDLRDVLNMQQQQCAYLIEEKNKLITDLQQELRSKDDQYVKELKKEAEDIDLLIERMEEQIKSLTKCYSTELHQIERAFELERRELLADNQQKWEQMMQERRDKELEYLTTRMRKVEEYEQLLKQLRVQDAEEYNMIKIKLETEVQILEQQLQQMKATYQLNQEKLEYNFQVLKKRDEENTITKSQQKRKITRLQDILNKLKIKFDKQVKQYQEDNQALTDDYKRITEQYKELQKKMRHFAVVDTRKFYEIWIMNEEEIKQLAQKAFEVDRLIHEQQLGLPWIMPEFWFMENMGPVIPQYKKKKSAVQLAEEVMFSAASQVVVEDSKTHSYQTSASQQIKGKMDSEDSGHRSDSSTVSRPTLKMLLELLCDESGFLIESKLLKLLLPLERDEQSLLKLDAVFQALGIENEDDVYKLAEFLIRYKEQQQSDDQDRDEEKEALLQEEVYPGQEELSSDAHMEGKRKPLLFRPYASNLIHPDDVLKAVRAFVTEHQKQRERTHQTKLVNLDERDDTEDAAYWEAIANVIPSSKVKVWEALLSAMEKHHHILTERSTLITETDSLKQQNTELRMLLHQYINSTVTAQLEIPPMQTVQMQFSQT